MPLRLDFSIFMCLIYPFVSHKIVGHGDSILPHFIIQDTKYLFIHLDHFMTSLLPKYFGVPPKIDLYQLRSLKYLFVFVFTHTFH